MTSRIGTLAALAVALGSGSAPVVGTADAAVDLRGLWHATGGGVESALTAAKSRFDLSDAETAAILAESVSQ